MKTFEDWNQGKHLGSMERMLAQDAWNTSAENSAEEIAKLEFSWAGCSQQLKDACADLEAVEKQRDELAQANETHRELARISRDNELKANLIANEQAAEISRLKGVIAKAAPSFNKVINALIDENPLCWQKVIQEAREALAAIKEEGL